VQDLSSNGTFVNGRKLKSAQDGADRRWLSAGDRLSLVMSVKPLHEQYYIYHTGELWLRQQLTLLNNASAADQRF